MQSFGSIGRWQALASRPVRPPEVGITHGVRIALLTLTAASIAYLALLAMIPSLRDGLPPAVRWFGSPGSWQSVLIVVGLILALCVFSFRSGGGASSSLPVTIVLGLTAVNCVLSFASYWNCHDATHPMFVTPLNWTLQLVKGSTGQLQLNSGRICPLPTPAALEVARLTAMGVIFFGVATVGITLFHAQLDRFRARFARSVTVVVGVDDDSQSVVGAVARTLEPGSHLVLVADNPERMCVTDSRGQGARVIPADLGRPDSLAALPFWHKANRLYLLDADPVTNVDRLRAIGQRMTGLGVNRRIPLIVRIDDPWHAAAWRAEQFGGSDTRWAADTVGKYEVTACRLLDDIVAQPVDRILICGTSPLTLALCADYAQRQLERDFFDDSGDRPLPTLTLVGDAADEYRRDHEFRQKRFGLPSTEHCIDAVTDAPTLPTLLQLIDADRETGPGAKAVVFVDGKALLDPTIGTRLATRFPNLRIYAWNPDAGSNDDREPIFGQLRTYRMAMDLPEGQAHDAWERAAKLIHERYVATVGGTSPASRPWAELSEFYRGSNRRQVRNALWIVEQIGGHTWNIIGDSAEPVAPRMSSGEPLEQLAAMGFDRSTALAMARAEHEDWSRYYRKAGWRHGERRDDHRKTHPKLVDWPAIESNPGYLHDALASLATTLAQLRELGYRSRPAWQRFRRIGVVTAEQQHRPWTWTTETGDTMRAQAGDWLVRDPSGNRWSVRDDIFRDSHEHVDNGQWRRTGFVFARPARDGELIETLEGRVTAAEGGWIVKGDRGEQWPVPPAQFAQRYEGPVE